MIARLFGLVESAVEAVINSVVDRLVAAWLEADEMSIHVHGAWCHPSADGCPDRPGM